MKTLKIKEPVRGHFNTSSHKAEEIREVVISQYPHWTDTERKSKEKLWMHRHKSFRPDAINTQTDFIKINFSNPNNT